MTLDASRYFGASLYTMSWLYHTRDGLSREQLEALAEAYAIVWDFQAEQWEKNGPRSIENVEP